MNTLLFCVIYSIGFLATSLSKYRLIQIMDPIEVQTVKKVLLSASVDLEWRFPVKLSSGQKRLKLKTQQGLSDIGYAEICRVGQRRTPEP